MSRNFIQKLQSSDEHGNGKAPIFPTLLWLIKLLDNEKTMEEFTQVMSVHYNTHLTEDDILKLNSYLDGVRAKITSDATELATITNNLDMSVKIARAIWFTKVFPAILGLEFATEDESSLDLKFLN